MTDTTGTDWRAIAECVTCNERVPMSHLTEQWQGRHQHAGESNPMAERVWLVHEVMDYEYDLIRAVCASVALAKRWVADHPKDFSIDERYVITEHEVIGEGI